MPPFSPLPPRPSGIPFSTQSSTATGNPVPPRLIAIPKIKMPTPVAPAAKASPLTPPPAPFEQADPSMHASLPTSKISPAWHPSSSIPIAPSGIIPPSPIGQMQAPQKSFTIKTPLQSPPASSVAPTETPFSPPSIAKPVMPPIVAKTTPPPAPPPMAPSSVTMPSIMPPLPSGFDASDFVVPTPKPTFLKQETPPAPPVAPATPFIKIKETISAISPQPVEPVLKPIEEKLSALPLRVPTKLPSVTPVARPVQDKTATVAAENTVARIRQANVVQEGDLSDIKLVMVTAIIALVTAGVLAAAFFEKLPF
ncbi:MAG: hypothetical protein V1746_07600 [bacterium]